MKYERTIVNAKKVARQVLPAYFTNYPSQSAPTSLISDSYALLLFAVIPVAVL
jgi:hypothetical protein